MRKGLESEKILILIEYANAGESEHGGEEAKGAEAVFALACVSNCNWDQYILMKKTLHRVLKTHFFYHF